MLLKICRNFIFKFDIIVRFTGSNQLTFVHSSGLIRCFRIV